MEEALVPMLKALAASGPLAVALLIALWHQTKELTAARAEIKQMQKEHQAELGAQQKECKEEIHSLQTQKEQLFERVLDTFKESADE